MEFSKHRKLSGWNGCMLVLPGYIYSECLSGALTAGCCHRGLWCGCSQWWMFHNVSFPAKISLPISNGRSCGCCGAWNGAVCMIYAVAPELKADSIIFAEHVDFVATAASRYITDWHVPFDTNILGFEMLPRSEVCRCRRLPIESLWKMPTQAFHR